jgi:hypothetical protein
MRGSRFFRWLRRIVLLLLLAAVAGAAALYLLASRVPRQYRPADLSRQERDAAGHEFVESGAKGFYNKVPVREPFAFSLSEDRLNAYLASMDEISGLVPGGRPGEVRERLRRAGLADPAVAIGDGVLTLMVRLAQYGKVLSADLSFDFLPDGRLRVRLREVRVGSLAVPDWLVRGRLHQLRRAIAPAMRRALAGNDVRGLSVEDVSAVLTAVLAAIDEEPISPDLPKYHQRVVGIDLHDRALKIRFQPVIDPNQAPLPLPFPPMPDAAGGNRR